MDAALRYLEYTIGYVLSAAYGLYIFFRLSMRFLKNPTDRFWVERNREIPPQCLNDPSLGNHAYVRVKNVNLHYVEAGDHTKPLMLLLHGFPEFWYSWRHQLKEFSSDYWVVAVDMRGYGDSDKPVGRSNYKMDLLVADVKGLIAALGKEQCTLVAHDWGGCIAWSVVLTEPQLIHSYVIMNSIHPIAYHNRIKKHLSQMKKSWYVFFFQIPWLPELWCRVDDIRMFDKWMRSESVKTPPNITDEDIEAYKFYFGKPGAFTHPINYYRANFMLNAQRKISTLEKSFPPGLIIFGDRDLFIDKEIQEETTRLVANTTLVYIKDANHFVQQDDPKAVNMTMRNFLNNLELPQQILNSC